MRRNRAVLTQEPQLPVVIVRWTIIILSDREEEQATASNLPCRRGRRRDWMAICPAPRPPRHIIMKKETRDVLAVDRLVEFCSLLKVSDDVRPLCATVPSETDGSVKF